MPLNVSGVAEVAEGDFLQSVNEVGNPVLGEAAAIFSLF
jgi:hypothetical protein